MRQHLLGPVRALAKHQKGSSTREQSLDCALSVVFGWTASVVQRNVAFKPVGLRSQGTMDDFQLDLSVPCRAGLP